MQLLNYARLSQKFELGILWFQVKVFNLEIGIPHLKHRDQAFKVVFEN